MLKNWDFLIILEQFQKKKFSKKYFPRDENIYRHDQNHLTMLEQ
jgi:hypothetical protein